MDTKTNSSILLLLATALLLGSWVKSVSAQSTLTVPRGSYKADAAFGLSTGRPLAGIIGDVSVESPEVKRPKDYSFGGTGLVSTDPNNPLNYTVLISAGYAVFPALFGNSKSRFSIQYRNVAPNGKVTGCFNLNCPGFVPTQKGKDIIGTVLDVEMKPPLKKRKTIHLRIEQDTKTKQWMIFYEGIKLGYYPNSILTGLTKRPINAALVGGAMVDSTGDKTPPSQIGSGILPSKPVINRRAAYVTNVKLKEGTGRILTPDDQGRQGPVKIEPIVTNPTCYAVNYNQKPNPISRSGIFYYGGPGCSA